MRLKAYGFYSVAQREKHEYMLYVSWWELKIKIYVMKSAVENRLC